MTAAAVALAVIWITFHRSYLAPDGSDRHTVTDCPHALCIGVQILIIVWRMCWAIAVTTMTLQPIRRIASGAFDVPGRARHHAVAERLVRVVDKTAALSRKSATSRRSCRRRSPTCLHSVARSARRRFGRNAPGRLAGVDLPTSGRRASFAGQRRGLRSRLILSRGFTPAQIDGTEEKDISWKAGERTMSFKGQAYLLHFCLPHFFFHCTTAYNIARHNGVEIGKRDYMGSL
jgi:hypothetical protein